MTTAITVPIYDQQTGVKPGHSHVMDLLFKQSAITLKELIKKRVLQELKASDKPGKSPRALVQITVAEEVLNQSGHRASVKSQETRHVEQAWRAFEKGAYYVFVDDRQVEALSDTIELHPKLKVEFYRLVALVGG